MEPKRVYVFIDASNLWQVQKSKQKILDYQKVKNYLHEYFSATELKCFFYTAYPADGTRSYSLDSKHQFYTYLKRGLGFEVRKKELKRIVITSGGDSDIMEKGNMDVEMTIDVMHHIDDYDVAIFFTGDSDFLALVRYIRNHDKKVFIFSSKNNISQELRTGGDGYFDVLSIGDIWRGVMRHRSDKSP